MDERLEYLVEHWDELGWYDRKRIAWIRFREINRIDFWLVLHTITASAIIASLLLEHHINHLAGLLTFIVLFHFYVTLLYRIIQLNTTATQ